MENILLREKQGPIEILTLNDPKKLNALSEEMLSKLQETFDEISTQNDVRAVILRGQGKAFCAGHDLKQMQQARQSKDGGQAYFYELFKKCGKMMLTISQMPQPVIAEVRGIATAAGCQLVATCDLAIASSNASFGVNGVNIGLFCSTPMVALSRNIGRKKTFEMLVTGEFLDPDMAMSFGLINKVVPDHKTQRETLDLAEKITKKLGQAVKIGKKAYYKQIELPIDEAYEYTAEVMATNMLFKDTDEGINAFIEKRTPSWEPT